MLTRMLRDVGLAEEIAQDALVVALEKWPESGLPESPGAWLMATAKRRAIDHLRRGKMLDEKHATIGRDASVERPDETERIVEALDDSIGDDLLRLLFIACHPVLSPDARSALTLRLLGGLTTGEIARAFLVPEATIGQRIVRAKRTLAEARVPFESPGPEEIGRRLGSVLEVLYLIFNEGYAASAGDDWMRPELVRESLRLTRVLAGLAPEEPEVFGLLALLELQSSRMAARLDADGAPILLDEQDRTRWDHLAIRRGLEALARAGALGGSLGPYGLQAAIAACHARAETAAATDWTRIAALYDALAALVPSPVVELNRAVAVGRAFGPAAGLEIVEAIAAEPALRDYPYLDAVRGDLLFRMGRRDEAREAFERAATQAPGRHERGRMLARAAACAAPDATVQ